MWLTLPNWMVQVYCHQELFDKSHILSRTKLIKIGKKKVNSGLRVYGGSFLLDKPWSYFLDQYSSNCFDLGISY